MNMPAQKIDGRRKRKSSLQVDSASEKTIKKGKNIYTVKHPQL